MTNEELPEIHKGEPAFWAGDQDSKEAAAEEAAEDVGPDAQHGIAQLSRKELAILATKLSAPSGSNASDSKPQEEGSDTYLG